MVAQSAIMVLVRSDRSFFRRRITGSYAAALPGRFCAHHSPHRLPGTWHDTAPVSSGRSEEDRVRSPQCRKHLCLPWCPVSNLLPENTASIPETSTPDRNMLRIQMPLSYPSHLFRKARIYAAILPVSYSFYFSPFPTFQLTDLLYSSHIWAYSPFCSSNVLWVPFSVISPSSGHRYCQHPRWRTICVRS